MRLLQVVETFLREDGWEFVALASRTVLRTHYQGKHGNWTCYAQTREEDEQFLFYAVCPIRVPENKRTAMSEFITRANYGMIIGNFEMDFSDGEIRFKTSMDVENSELTSSMVRAAVYWSIAMMDRYLPGFLRVLGGNVSAEAAIDEIEREDLPDLSKS